MGVGLFTSDDHPGIHPAIKKEFSRKGAATVSVSFYQEYPEPGT
jgi:hypothetical protein